MIRLLVADISRDKCCLSSFDVVALIIDAHVFLIFQKHLVRSFAEVLLAYFGSC